MADQEAPKPCWSNILKSQPAPSTTPSPSSADSLAGVFAGSCKSTKGIAVAVVDANAIIAGGERLSQCADKFVSVPEVMDEIRDPVSRHRLAFVPFTVQTTEPSPESLRKVTNFARATGDLQTLSDVDIKLIALTYTLEAQIHGTAHLRECPPPIHTVNVKRLPEKDLPGWGSNVPNLEEWEALENEEEDKPSGASRILPLRDLNLNVVSDPDPVPVPEVQNKEAEGNGDEKPKRFPPKKKEEISIIDGKKMVVDGIDASNGEVNGDEGDWVPAVSRSSQRRYHKRQARRESAKGDEESLATKLEEMRLLEEESLKARGGEEGIAGEELGDLEVEEEEEEMLSEVSESVDDASSEQSWTLRSLSESSVACITSDFAMQNVILQMGLRLVAPGGMQIRKLQRWVLRCHACYTVTPEVEKIFCPKCGNGGTLRKVAVTVGENGVTVSARRPRVSLRGTKFSLPLPQGGREAFTKNLILREDQLPQKYLHPKTKKKAVNKDEGDDFFIGRSDNCIFSQHHCDKKSALQPPVRKALQVFSGKRNPNDNHYSRSMHK